MAQLVSNLDSVEFCFFFFQQYTDYDVCIYSSIIQVGVCTFVIELSIRPPTFNIKLPDVLVTIESSEIEPVPVDLWV